MRQQLAQGASEIKALQASADKLKTLRSQHPIGAWLTGTGSTEVDDAQKQLEDAKNTQKSLQQAIAFIEGKRGAIVSGKEDMDSVIDQANKIMGGDLSDLGGKPKEGP